MFAAQNVGLNPAQKNRTQRNIDHNPRKNAHENSETNKYETTNTIYFYYY